MGSILDWVPLRVLQGSNCSSPLEASSANALCWDGVGFMALRFRPPGDPLPLPNTAGSFLITAEGIKEKAEEEEFPLSLADDDGEEEEPGEPIFRISI